MSTQWRVLPPSEWAPKRYYVYSNVSAGVVEGLIRSLAEWAGEVLLIFAGGTYSFDRSIRVPRPINRIRVLQQAACTMHLPDGVPLFIRADWNGTDFIQGDPTDRLDLSGTHWSIVYPEGSGITGVTYTQNDQAKTFTVPYVPSTRR